MKKIVLLFALMGCLNLTLTGCGGGGGGGSAATTPVTPPTPPVATTYAVSGTVSGLASQSITVSLKNNSGTPITSGNGEFTVATGLSNGASYNVTVTPPSGTVCQVSDGSGKIAGANVSDVSVICQAVQPVVMACGTETNIGSGNEAPLVVDGFPCANGGAAQFANNFNEPYTSVKVCAHGSTTNCQVIDHVIVDSGSTGFRVAATALNSSLQPGVTGGLAVTAGSTTGTTLTECEQYVSSYVYGPIVTADIYIGSKSAINVPIQVFGGTNYPVPTTCSTGGGTSTNTTQTFNGNGLIGVSFDAVDEAYYFDCNNGSLKSCANNSAFNGLPNLVESYFAPDNNGVVLTLPSVGALGSLAPVVGSLIFGVNTETNNSAAASVVAVSNDSLEGSFALKIGSGAWGTAYIDSGTAVDFFNDSADTALTACGSATGFQGMYCPATDQSITFILANSGTTTQTGTLAYSVTSAANPDIPYAAVAISNIAGPIATSSTAGGSSAIGLSSFFGHSFYFLFTGQTAPGTGLGGTSPATVTGPVNAIK